MIACQKQKAGKKFFPAFLKAVRWTDVLRFDLPHRAGEEPALSRDAIGRAVETAQLVEPNLRVGVLTTRATGEGVAHFRRPRISGLRRQLEHLSERTRAVRIGRAVDRAIGAHRNGLPRTIAGEALAADDRVDDVVIAAVGVHLEHVAVALGEARRGAIERAVRILDETIARYFTVAAACERVQHREAPIAAALC